MNQEGSCRDRPRIFGGLKSETTDVGVRRASPHASLTLAEEVREAIPAFYLTGSGPVTAD